MGKRGPKPKPTGLRALQGGKKTSHRPEPEDEPKPKLALPSCPAHLSAEAKREWKRVTRELYELGYLASIDRAMLAAYCQAYGRWVKAEKKMRYTGEIVRTKNKNLIQSPWLAVANRALAQMQKFADEFGLTPSARTGISTTKARASTPLQDFKDRLKKARARSSAKRVSKPPRSR